MLRGVKVLACAPPLSAVSYSVIESQGAIGDTLSMRVLGSLAAVQVVCVLVVPRSILGVLNHSTIPRGVTELSSVKEEVETLASLHVVDNWKIKRAEEPSWGMGSLTSASDILGQLSLLPTLDRLTPLRQQLQQDFLWLLTPNLNLSSNAGNEVTRPRKKREDRGVMYLPVRGGGTTTSCPSYADTVSASLTQMAFASMAVTVFNAVFNVVNNINNNNNNNNINSNNNVASNNANAASNNNNGNQVDVVLPPVIPGRRRRHVAAKHTSDSHHLNHGTIEGVKGCVSRKTYARAALAILRNLQNILEVPKIPIRKVKLKKKVRGGAVLFM